MERDPHYRALAKQSLKAIAELDENSVHAHAETIVITRGREHGGYYVKIKDDGDGVPRDPNGLPDLISSREASLDTTPWKT